jgi:hypothetical protein
MNMGSQACQVRGYPWQWHSKLQVSDICTHIFHCVHGPRSHEEVLVPLRGQLWSPLLRLEIHVVHPKSHGETESPLEVVHETPHKVAAHICSSPICMPTSKIFLELLQGLALMSLLKSMMRT